MPRLYLSAVIGDGTPRRGGAGNPFRAKVDDLPHTAYQVIALPSAANGSPLKGWTLVLVEAADFAPLDADPEIVAIGDLAQLDFVVTNAVRNRINAVLGRLGITTTAVTGETVRDVANRLLAELGAGVTL